MLIGAAAAVRGMHDYNGPGASVIFFGILLVMVVILVAVFGRKSR
jgi:hypothetical protein